MRQLITIVAFTGFLSGCGLDICVGNIGKCNYEVKGRPTNVLKAAVFPSDTVDVGRTIRIDVSGGTPPYRFAQPVPAGRVEIRSDDDTTATVKGVASGAVEIQFADFRNQIGSIRITVRSPIR